MPVVFWFDGQGRAKTLTIFFSCLVLFQEGRILDAILCPMRAGLSRLVAL
jgi:hypothetical protein